MSYNESAVKTMVASGALGKYLRVTFGSAGTAGQMILAGAAVTEIGVTERPAFEALDDVPVRLRTAQGTGTYIAAAPIAVGAVVRCAASGKVTTGGADPIIGTAMSAATADGDHIEVLRT